MVRVKSHRVVQVQFRQSTIEASCRRLFEISAPLRKAMGHVERDLLAVTVPDHVVVEYDTSHPGELHASRLHESPCRVFELLGTLRHESLNRSLPGILKTTARKVRCVDSGEWKTIVIELNDTHFNRGMERGSDLTIRHLDGESTLFHMLELKRR